MYQEHVICRKVGSADIEPLKMSRWFNWKKHAPKRGNLMAFKSETVEAFIAEAEKELADVLLRKTELEELIRKCKTLFGGDQRQQSLPLEIPASSTHLIPKVKTKGKGKSRRIQRDAPLWQLVEGLFKEKGWSEIDFQPIRQTAVRRGWITDDSTGTKILYRAMNDKSEKGEVFVHTGRGTWALKGATDVTK